MLYFVTPVVLSYTSGWDFLVIIKWSTDGTTNGSAYSKGKLVLSFTKERFVLMPVCQCS